MPSLHHARCQHLLHSRSLRQAFKCPNDMPDLLVRHALRNQILSLNHLLRPNLVPRLTFHH